MARTLRDNVAEILWLISVVENQQPAAKRPAQAQRFKDRGRRGLDSGRGDGGNVDQSQAQAETAESRSTARPRAWPRWQQSNGSLLNPQSGLRLDDVLAGAMPGPFEAWLLQRGMRTLFLRVRRAS